MVIEGKTFNMNDEIHEDYWKFGSKPLIQNKITRPGIWSWLIKPVNANRYSSEQFLAKYGPSY